MQQFKPLFSNPHYLDTFTNVQKCLRLNDLSQVGDGTHRLTFEMIGLFSFRQWSVLEGIIFMWEFLSRLQLTPDYVTIHPDKIQEWSKYYESYHIPIKSDPECLWSDGNIGGYCTEFYLEGVEIGNIVNPLGTCLDIGFGLERLLLVSDSLPRESRLSLLEQTCGDLISSGITLGHNQQGYILKKLVTICVLEGSSQTGPEFEYIRQQQIKHYRQYLINKQKRRFQGQSSKFWLNTYGIDEEKLPLYEQLLKKKS